MPDFHEGNEVGNQGAASLPAWRGLTDAALKYVVARGELAQIETQEAAAQLARVAVFGVMAAVFALGAWALTVPALVWLVCTRNGWPLDRGFMMTGAAHAALALIFLRAMLNRLARARLFAETLEQFKKDRAWIMQKTEKH